MLVKVVLVIFLIILFIFLPFILACCVISGRCSRREEEGYGKRVKNRSCKR